MLRITDHVEVPLGDIELNAVRAQGAGGQNVNKVSSAIHLRFDFERSTSLPDALKEQLRTARDRRISADGVIVIKSQRYRTQEQNRRDALERLQALLQKALEVQPERKATHTPRRVREKRLADKAHRARLKEGRTRPGE